MNQIDQSQGRQILFSRMISKTPDEFFANMNKTYNGIPSQLNPWSWSLKEILQSNTCWYQTTVASKDLFNGLYRSVCNTYGFYNKETPSSVEDIKNNYSLLPDEDKEIIKTLRSNYCDNIPIIAISTNKKEFYIYDGFHAAIAKALDNKEITILFAHRDYFSCLFKRPNVVPEYN